MKVFGTELDQLLIQERLLGLQAPTGAPSIVEECLSFLIPAHANEEGLFRISGMKEDITTLKQKCDAAAGQGVAFRLENAEENCHNVSGLLKQYIRELPSPLYPKVLHTALIAAGKIEDEAQRSDALSDVARQLPLSHYALLRRLTCMLHDLLANVESTKMTSANLSTVWAPNLMWDREVETDPTACLAFSRDINLAIQYTIESAYIMFKADELIDSMTASASGAELPKRRSVFDIEPELERTNSGNTLSGSCVDVSRLAGGDAMTESEDAFTPRSLDSSDGLTALTPRTPGFEDMFALATSSSKKRPRSIYVGSAAAINSDDIDSLAELGRSSSSAAAAIAAYNASQGSLSSATGSLSAATAAGTSSAGATPGSAARRSIKRRTRVIALDKAAAQAVQNVPMSPPEEETEDTPYAKRRKLLASSGSLQSLNQLSSSSSASLLEALRSDPNAMDTSEDSIGSPIMMSHLGASSHSITAVSVPDSSVTASSSVSITSANTAAPSPRKSGLRASIRKSLRMAGNSIRNGRSSSNVSSSSSAIVSAPAPEVQLYYYLDTDVNSVGLRKFLNALNVIPCEIRNAQRDPMSMDEVLFFAKTCSDIVVVRRTDKAYTTSHKISDLSEAELMAILCNSNGEPRAPAILSGSTFLVGYDKALKDVFKYYLHRNKKTATPIRV